MLEAFKDIMSDEGYVFYFDYLESDNINRELDRAHADSHTMMAEIPANKHEHRYEEGKFTVKEVFTHIIDCEYEYNETALTILKNAGHDMSAHTFSTYNTEENGVKTMEEIKADFDETRVRTKAFYASLTEDMLKTQATFDGYDFTPYAIALFLAGHELHHHKIIKERYL